MKNIISKLKSRRRNQGSGLVLVIVAVAFIGILVGSLLTAVGYAYRLKLYDYNAKDNFYYLEQAMDEVYAGVGNQTLTYMQEAYAEVVNDMVKYNAETKNYVTEDASVLNTRFKHNFLIKVASSPLLDASGDALDSFLRGYITNSDITLVKGRAKVVKYILDGTTEKIAGPLDTDFSSIVIKNVTLSRTSNYNRSQANGDFTQTISTDIVISQPDFTMEFNSINTDYSTLFDYSMIADNGIEITQNQEEISISGNVYAAADFYNKKYNNYSNEVVSNDLNMGYGFGEGITTLSYYGQVRGKSGEQILGSDLSATKYVSSDDIPSVTTVSGKTYYNFHNGPVTSKVSTTLRNSRLNAQSLVYPYDGVNENSMYSGLYIKGARVNMQSSELIVPGTIAVLDGANLSLYGKTGLDVGESDVWTDNVVLGGIGTAASYPKALIRGNVHVRDDLELDANYSDFQLIGRYYGFGDSTKSDAREYVPFVDEKAFYYTVTDGTTATKFVRGHYNSSAIVVNGQQAKLNLSETNALFLAGRAYVELSKDYGNAVRKRAVEVKDESDITVENIIDDTDELGNPITEKQFVFNGNTDDFKTGESVSLKTNQLAYVPVNIAGTTTSSVEEVTKADGTKYYLIGLPREVQTAVPFAAILGAGTKLEKVPCLRYTTTDGVEYYYDFQTIYELYYEDKGINTINFNYNFKSSETATLELIGSGDITIRSAEDLAKQFILYYAAELTNYDDSSARLSLKDISGEYGGFKFDEGTIELPTAATKVYSSGAITAKSGTNFTITAEENLLNALQGTDSISGQQSEYDKMVQKTAAANTTAQNVALTADDFEDRYAYVKWALENYNKLEAQSVSEWDFLKTAIAQSGEGIITPINRYLNMNQITAGTDIHPALSGVSGGTAFTLQSGYSVWISDQDVVVSTDRSDGVVQGIVITKGSVFFDQTVSKFEGLIISGDKIFVDNLALGQLPIGRSRSGASGTKILTSISASPEVVRAILNECMGMTGDPTSGAYAKKVLNMFKSHENFAHMEGVIKTVDVSFKTIDTIQYSDVVRYNNWMKNVSVAATTAGSGTTP